MSSYLWKCYLEDDVDSFRRLLANATYNNWPHAQKGSNSGAVGHLATIGLGTSTGTLASSPKTTPKGRKASGWASGTITAGSKGLNSPGPVNLVLTRADLNSRDVSGVTILHHAASSASENAISFASALLECPLVDLYIQDLESGWTVLHRALYFGNVTIARSIMDRDSWDVLGHTSTGALHSAGGLIKVKDKEGNSPFDVFGATITNRILRHGENVSGVSEENEEYEKDSAYGDTGSNDEDGQRRKAVIPRTDIQGDDCFTFGSNKNFTLGFGDEDDRQYPERITLKRPEHLLRRFYREHQQTARSSVLSEADGEPGADLTLLKETSSLPSLILSKPIIIQDVALSKLHTAVLTTDPESNLYVCGFGPGGRLGTGDERTRFNFVCIEGGGLAGKKVVNVGLGQHHTLAVSDEGETFSWGVNPYGQLGYTLPKPVLKDDDPVQTSPRQLYGPLKRETVIGAAASRIHSVVHTSSSLFTFGKNEGQLGLVDSDARSLETQVIPRKVAASLFSSLIRMVSAIDRATICLLENNEVWVFANYGYTKMSFPLEGSINYFLKNTVTTTRYDNMPNHISKITSGGDTICAMSRMGDVFTVNVSQKLEPGPVATSTTNPTKIRNALSQPHRVWSLRKGHMAVRDVDVGQDGSVIICTESGSVWRRVKRAKIKDATASGSADYKPKDYKFSRVPGLTRVTAVRSNTFGAYAAVRKDCEVTRTQIIIDDQYLWKDIAPLLAFSGFELDDEDSETENPRLRFWAPLLSHDASASIKRAVLSSDDLEADVQTYLLARESCADDSYDVEVRTTFSEVCIPAHRFIFSSRSVILRQALAEMRQTGTYSISEVLSLERDANGKVTMTLQGYDFLTLLNLLLYLYTDTLVDIWHHTKNAPMSAFRFRQVRTELMKIASRLDLRSLEAAVRVMVEPKRILDSDMDRAIIDPMFFDDGDVEVQLSDAAIRVHSAIICRRCPFFEGLFNGRAGGRWLSSRRELVQDSSDAISIDLKHVEQDIFKLVLRYMYADVGEELFDDVVTGDLDEFLDVVMEVMSVANELMLDRLSQICQKVLGRFVTTRLACQLLNAVAPCSVTDFKDAGLEYLCLNLEAMLENHLLDGLDEELLLELDQVVRENQRACLPFAKSGRGDALLLEKYPDLAEIIDRGRQAKINAMALQARLSEIENRLSTSLRTKTGSSDALASSPTQHRGFRKSSKETKSPQPSPKLKARTSTADLMFNMDEENKTDDESNESPALPSCIPLGDKSPSITPNHASSPPASLPLDERWYNSKGKALSSPRGISSPISPLVSPPTQRFSAAAFEKSVVSPAVKPSSAASTMGKPWGSPALPSSKLELKDIMNQTSSIRTSNLSLGLSSESRIDEKAANAFSGKLSQRERKKQQQQQQQLHQIAAPILPVLTPEKPPQGANPTSPWQTASNGPKVSLKDVLQSGKPGSPNVTQSPLPRTSSVPPLNLQQTVAKKGPFESKPPAIGPSIHGPSQQHRSVSSPTTTRLVNPKTPQSSPSPSSAPSRRTETTRNDTHKSTTSSSPSVQIQSIRHQPAHAEPCLQLSMADILSQQQAEKDIIREAVAKRSLQEIQEEQAFQEWWDMESRKVREEEEAAARTTVSSASRGGAVGGRGKARGGMRGRGGRGVASAGAGAGASASNTEKGKGRRKMRGEGA
ncbi:MAG: hypothetical protein M1827_007607 [Pycnora praestabilis]|nr:MAG: hypothetical protein M1827_007607 [Pycnora praestabilis]